MLLLICWYDRTEEVFYMHARLSMLRETHGPNSHMFENEVSNPLYP